MRKLVTAQKNRGRRLPGKDTWVRFIVLSFSKQQSHICMDRKLKMHGIFGTEQMVCDECGIQEGSMCKKRSGILAKIFKFKIYRNDNTVLCMFLSPKDSISSVLK